MKSFSNKNKWLVCILILLSGAFCNTKKQLACARRL